MSSILYCLRTIYQWWKEKNYKCISCSINWYVSYYTKFHLKGLHSFKKCWFGWLSSPVFMLTIHFYTYYVYWVHSSISCCHSHTHMTVSAYVFVILNYSISELQLSGLELIFSYMPFVHYSKNNSLFALRSSYLTWYIKWQDQFFKNYLDL